MQPDTIIPDAANPQTWNRYSYALNNPIRYNDPDGHCPVCAVALVDTLPFVVIAAVVTLAVVAINPEARAAAINSMEYISGRTKNAWRDLKNKIEDTNNDRDHFKIYQKCKDNPKYCLAAILGVITIGAVAIATGGIGQNESLATYPTFDTLIPSLTPSSTATPSNTSTSTPSCPPYNNGCPNTSTSTPNTTSTPPVSTPLTPPIYTPAPPKPGGPAIPI